MRGDTGLTGAPFPSTVSTILDSGLLQACLLTSETFIRVFRAFDIENVYVLVFIRCNQRLRKFYEYFFFFLIGSFEI